MKNVLIVDDDEDIREILSIQLNALGYDSDTACDVDSAIKQLEGGTNYSYVITDILMPGRTGVSLCNEIKETRAGTRVIVISGGLKLKGIEAADGFLQKPFSIGDLKSCLDSNA